MPWVGPAAPRRERDAAGLTGGSPAEVLAEERDGHGPCIFRRRKVRRTRRSRTTLRGRVILMFQPGEEGWHGARYMLEEGLLEGVDPAPSGAFALHISTSEPTGVITGRGGADVFDIFVWHGGLPTGASVRRRDRARNCRSRRQRFKKS